MLGPSSKMRRLGVLVLALAAGAGGARPAYADQTADAQWKQIITHLLQQAENRNGLRAWMEKNIWPSFTDCGVGAGGVAVDSATWQHGFLGEYYPANRGNPATTPDYVPSCYTVTPVCFQQEAGTQLEPDMTPYNGWPQAIECALTSTRFTKQAPLPAISFNSAIFRGRVDIGIKYWEKKTSFAKAAMTPSKRNAPTQAHAGQVVTGVGYGIIVVDAYPRGVYKGKQREAEVLGLIESSHRRFCYMSEIAARGGPECALVQGSQ